MLSCENCKSKNKNLCNHGKNWSYSDNVRLMCSLSNYNYSAEHLPKIAERLGRTERAVLFQMLKLNTPFKGCHELALPPDRFDSKDICFNSECASNGLGFICIMGVTQKCCRVIKRPCDLSVKLRKTPSCLLYRKCPVAESFSADCCNPEFLKPEPSAARLAAQESLKCLKGQLAEAKENLAKEKAELTKAGAGLNAAALGHKRVLDAISRASQFNLSLLGTSDDELINTCVVGPGALAKLLSLKAELKQKIETLEIEVATRNKKRVDAEKFVEMIKERITLTEKLISKL